MPESVQLCLPLDTIGMKRCRKCSGHKPLDAFHKQKSAPDGTKSICKVCACANARAYGRAHRDERLRYMREWHEANREHEIEKGHRRYHENKVAINTHRAFVRQQNPEKYRERERQNPRDKKVRVIAEARRRARKYSATHTDFTVAEWQEILAYFGHTCAYCGITGEPLHQEHMTPLSRGGDHTSANIVPSCRACNSRKHDRTLAEYLLRLDAIVTIGTSSPSRRG